MYEAYAMQPIYISDVLASFPDDAWRLTIP